LPENESLADYIGERLGTGREGSLLAEVDRRVGLPPGTNLADFHQSQREATEEAVTSHIDVRLGAKAGRTLIQSIHDIVESNLDAKLTAMIGTDTTRGPLSREVERVVRLVVGVSPEGSLVQSLATLQPSTTDSSAAAVPDSTDE